MSKNTWVLTWFASWFWVFDFLFPESNSNKPRPKKNFYGNKYNSFSSTPFFANPKISKEKQKKLDEIKAYKEATRYFSKTRYKVKSSYKPKQKIDFTRLKYR